MRKLFLSASILFILASPAAAHKGDCGHPISDGDTPTVSDAVYLLKATAQSTECDPKVCDVNSDCRVSVGDALHLLVSAAYGRRDHRCNEGCDEVLVCSDADTPMCGGYCPDGFGCTEVEKPKKEKRKNVCHKGLIAPWRARTIKVAQSALEAHLGHGDYRGRCEHEADYTLADGDPDGAGSDTDTDSERDDMDSDSFRDDDADSDSGSHADSDADSDSDSGKKRRRKMMCGCRPFEPTSTTTMPETTTTTIAEPTTTTTMPEPPTTTTTRPEPTTTTVPEPTTTTTMPEPSTTTTTRPGPTTTTIPEGTTTTTLATDVDNDGMNDSADPCPTDARNLCYGPVAVDVATDLPIRVNANSDPSDPCSGTRTDCSGSVWVDDFGFSLPSVSDVCSLPEGCPIAGIEAVFGCSDATTEDLMQCERFANLQSGQPPLGYSYAVANGEYVVNLYFANTFGGTAAPGSRVFDIVIENALEYASFDQIVAAGGSGILVVRSAVVNVEDGTLDIGFNAIAENPALKAIEVLAGPAE